MLSLQIAIAALHDSKVTRRCLLILAVIVPNESLHFSKHTATMIASKPLIALALLSGANALVAPQQRVLKTVMASTPVEESAAVETAPAAPMTTLEAAVLEATGTEPAAVAPAPVAAPPVAPAAPPPAPKGRVAQKRTENWSDLALPFAGRPALLQRELAADAGFDPLSLADSKVQLYVYREAELKHARLAMLAAAGWPLAELWDTGIAKTFGLEPIIEENGGRAVSVLNGGMGKISPVYWVSVVAFAAAVEALSEYKKGQAKAADSQWMLTGSYVPGDLGFDPLGLYTIFGKSESGKMLMETVGLGACSYSIDAAVASMASRLTAYPRRRRSRTADSPCSRSRFMLWRRRSRRTRSSRTVPSSSSRSGKRSRTS